MAALSFLMKVWCITFILGASIASTILAEESNLYLREIKPLFHARCYPCHGALKQQAGLRLDTGKAARLGSKNGSILNPQDPSSSPLILRAKTRDLEERMPPEGEPLTPGQIAQLENWIAVGATSPEQETPEADPRVHWAFQPPLRPPLPPVSVSNRNWARNPLDTFVLASLEKQGFQPSPPARSETLLRRLYLDLIGLPPTREEIHNFLSDPAPDAYEKIVDRLLDSPQHGERWARHWMDIWRYADWYGRRHVPDVWNSAPQIWRWRDWIVRSLNADKGYDRMVSEMLAGDELAPLEDDTAVATGYLIRNWYALNPNQWMRETVEHTGKAFLGLTFNCAHCHDHKYDPISQQDYFNFRAFFEPLYVRQDQWPGEPDPGPFQDYEYSSNRKVQKLGAVRVFDKELSAVTWFYTGGDERNRLTNRPPAQPSMPSFLGGDRLSITPLALPPAAFYPGLRNSIQTTELSLLRADLAAAQSALSAATAALAAPPPTLHSHLPEAPLELRQAAARATLALRPLRVELAAAKVAAAQSALTSAETRIAADRAQYSNPTSPISEESPVPERFANNALISERLARLLATQASLTAARLTLAELEAKSASDPTRSEGLKKATKQLADAQSAFLKAKTNAEPALTSQTSTNTPVYTRLSPFYPTHSTGRRQALAAWLTSRNNPLTARVAVNHLWTRHFHAPLVPSVFDFGRNGATPSHPELMDWLAMEFMDHDWSMKHLHRLIVTSSTYRQTSTATSPDAPAQTDPENRLLWRMNPGQMEAEVLRDSLLHLAGELDLTPVAYPLPNADAETSRRRSLYFECFPEPLGASAFAEMFDAPNPTECYRRSVSIIPQQALALTNSKLSRDRSRDLAQRLSAQLPPSDPEAFIVAAWEHILSRKPTTAELAACLHFLSQPLPSGTSSSEASEAPKASLVHALFNHNDFITIR